MAKPPLSTPHSDIDGVDQDLVHNVDAAVDAGQDADTVRKDQERSHGYPDYQPYEKENKDERTR